MFTMTSLMQILLAVVFLISSIDCTESSASSASTVVRNRTPASNDTCPSPTQTQSTQTSQTSETAGSATINGIKNFAASAFAAACSKTLLAPFDTIKTIQQQSHGDAGAKALGLVEAAKMITSRPGGFSELYSGLAVSAIGAMPSVGLYFGVYSYAKEKLNPLFQDALGSSPDGNHKAVLSSSAVRTLTIATSAAIGNTIASFSRVPYEVVKQKLQTGEYANTFQALSHMCKNGGMRAFFPMGGVAIQMIRDIPYAIVTLLTYECLRDNWVKVQKDKAPWRDMVAGGVAGGVGSFTTNPMDVIKTRLQVDSELYKGNVWICARKTLEEGGPAAFLRGSVPRLIHKIPANAAFFVFYEFFRKVLRVQDTKLEK